MTNCREVHENLFAYAEKKLPTALKLQLDKHIGECPECNRIVAYFNIALAQMEEQKSIEPRPFADTRIMQGIELQLEERQKTASSVFGRILQPALLSAGVAISLAIGFFIGSNFADTQSQLAQSDEHIEAVRSDLNAPEFMTDDLFHFTE